MQLVQQRFGKSGVITFLLSIIISIGSVWLIANWNMNAAFICILFCIAVPAAYYSLTNRKVGVLLILILSFTLPIINRIFVLYKYPMGLLFDVLILFSFIAILTDTKKEKTEATINNPIGSMLLVWAVANFFEVLNPIAPSMLGWAVAFKSNMYTVVYFFLFYYVIDSMKTLRLYIIVWFVIVFFAVLYAFKQRYIGLADYEGFVYTNDLKRSLYITWGKLRVFSFLNDPMSFAITLLYTLIVAFSLFFANLSNAIKGLLAVFFLITLWALLLTGTRTAYLLLPIGLVVFGLITLNKKILAMVVVGLVVGVVVVFTSDNPQFHIFKTAFRGSDDPSMNVRLKNQAFIQPHIQDKPFGHGLASTGGFGRIYNGGSFIGTFPPDSEYVRIAIENGWVGLFIWLAIQFLIFRKGIIDYFHTTNPENRIYFASFLTLFYIIIVAQYPQEALRVPPTNLLAGLVMAAIARIKNIQ